MLGYNPEALCTSLLSGRFPHGKMSDSQRSEG